MKIKKFLVEIDHQAYLITQELYKYRNHKKNVQKDYSAWRDNINRQCHQAHRENAQMLLDANLWSSFEAQQSQARHVNEQRLTAINQTLHDYKQKLLDSRLQTVAVTINDYVSNQEIQKNEYEQLKRESRKCEKDKNNIFKKCKSYGIQDIDVPLLTHLETLPFLQRCRLQLRYPFLGNFLFNPSKAPRINEVIQMFETWKDMCHVSAEADKALQHYAESMLDMSSWDTFQKTSDYVEYQEIQASITTCEDERTRAMASLNDQPSFTTFDAFIEYVIQHPDVCPTFKTVFDQTELTIHEQHQKQEQYYQKYQQILENIERHIEKLIDNLKRVHDTLKDKIRKYSKSEQSELEVNVKNTNYLLILQPYERYLHYPTLNGANFDSITVDIPELIDNTPDNNNGIDVLGITPEGLSLVGFNLMR